MTSPEEVLRRFDEISKQWEQDDPDALNPDVPPQPVNEMEGLDLSKDSPLSPDARPQDVAETPKSNEIPKLDELAKLMPPMRDEATPPAPTETEGHDLPPVAPEETTKAPAAMGMPELALASSGPKSTRLAGINGARAPIASAPGDAPDWNKLLADLQSAQSRSALGKTIQQGLHAAAPGFTPDMNVGNEDVAAAKAALEMPHMRQQYDIGQAQQAALGRKTADEAAAGDPNSPQNRRARDSIQAMYPNIPMPPGFESFTATDIDRFLKNPTAELARLKSAEGTANTKAAEAKALADKKASDEAAGVDALRRVTQMAPRLDELGLKPDSLAGLDRKSLEEVGRNLRDLPNAKQKQQNAQALGAPAVHSLADIKDPAERATVAALIAPGENHIDSTGMMRTAAGRKLMGLALQLDPNYSQAKYGVSKAVATQMATDKSVDALNTASNHLDELEKVVRNSGNLDSPTFNRIRTAFLNNSGSDAMTALETIGGTAAHEVAGAYGIATEAGRHEIEKMFAGAQSKQQLLERIHTQRALMGGKGKSMVHRAETYGAQAPAIEPNVLNPDQPETVMVKDAKTGLTRSLPKDKARKYLDGDPKRFQAVTGG